MNVMKKKLNSERGASISMALLVFLVCAVIGSAVLVAGTTASGRMSETAEYDQRYYAVNSAVKLLQKMIEDKEVVIVEKDGTFTLNDRDIESTFTSASFSSFQEEAAYQLVCVSPTPTFPIKRDGKDGNGNSFQLTATAGGTTISELSVKIDEIINADGSLKFLVSKTDPPKQAGKPSRTYSVRITFGLDKKVESKIENVANHAPVETVTTTMVWKLSDIETVEKKATIS